MQISKKGGNVLAVRFSGEQSYGIKGHLLARLKVAIGIPSGEKDELMGHSLVIHIYSASRYNKLLLQFTEKDGN